MFSLSGAAGNGGGVIWLVPGLVALIVGIILVSPFFLALLARVGGRAPVAIRLPLRDMARYRARSGSALSAISLGIMIAVIICAVAVARYANVFDYVGPNMTANTINVYSPPAAGSRARSARAERARGADGAGPPEPVGAAGDGARHRLRRRRQGRGRARQPGRGPAEPQRSGPAVERPDLRGDAGASAGLWHQPLVHPVQRRHPELAARTGRLGRATDLRRGRQGGRRLPGPGRRREQSTTSARPTSASPTRWCRRRASCPSARRHRTR